MIIIHDSKIDTEEYVSRGKIMTSLLFPGVLVVPQGERFIDTVSMKEMAFRRRKSTGWSFPGYAALRAIRHFPLFQTFLSPIINIL